MYTNVNAKRIHLYTGTEKILLGTKSPICGMKGLFEMDIKIVFIDQPDLTDLEASQFATTQLPAKVLQAVTADFSGNLDGYVVCDHKGN